MSDLLRPPKDACMAVLKPCPFCGSKWTQVRWIGFEDSPPCGYASGYRGECTDCGAMTLPALSVEAAEEAWNRRVTVGNDYISREAAVALLKKWADGYSYIETPTEDAINEFNAIPAADVRPVRPCDGCPFCVCEEHGVICPSDPDFRCDTRGGDT